MATYYKQRAGAGLIITEGTSPSPNGLGYPRIPGAYSDEQIAGWKTVTDAIHSEGSRMFLQIMHTGRVTHPENLPEGGRVLAPSVVEHTLKMYVDGKGELDIPAPQEMTAAEIEQTIQEYVDTATKAVHDGGFDGVELHAANGYLLEQFIHPQTNQRTDDFGGSIENRARFVLEVAKRTVAAIGADRVGIRVSPYGVFNEMPIYDDILATYEYLAKELSTIGITYIHIVDHSAMGAPEVPRSVKEAIRTHFNNTVILSGGYDQDRANQDLEANLGDLVAFGRPFLANPDLVERFKEGAELNAPDFGTFYTPGEQGYTDYPTMAEQATNA